MGYTELGSWIEYLQLGIEIIIGVRKCSDYKYGDILQSIIEEYKID